MAKKTGFIKRKRKFSAFEFVLLMTIGLTAMVHPSLSGMVDAIRAKISRVALHLRFTAQAAKFLQACLEMVLKQCVCTDRITPSALDAFRRVLIHDIHSSLNSNRWLTKKREVSFDKLYKRIQERAFHLLQNLLITVFAAVKQFLREINRLANACIKTRQPSRKTTLELLEDVHALLWP